MLTASWSVPVARLSMNSPPLPTVIPPMSSAVPLFWTKNVSLPRTVI
jgi:hypothetical protein